MKKSSRIALCGMLSAVSIVLILIGSVISVLSYAMPIFTGLVIIILINSVDDNAAWLVFTSVSLITVIFMPDKECALTYAFFFGYYPIIKPKIEKLKLKIIIKFLVFNAGIVLSQLIVIYVFGIPLDNFLGKITVLVLLAGANIIFVIYDRLINVFSRLYLIKYKKHIDKLLKH